MSNTVISIENVSKSYQLGAINTGTFYGDLKRWWARQRGRPDPYQKIGEADHGNRQGETLWALKDVSFQVRQGEALGIIGRNGAGKSTLLKILSRVTAPTSGEVKVKGRIASLLEVGTGFHPELTGSENIYLNGSIMGMNKAEIARKFDEIVGFSGVEQFIDTPVKRYSSGMYVRLAFSVAAHLDSEILVVDEVLAVGDAEFQKKCLGKMEDVSNEEGRTVLFVSHNMQSIARLCNQAILLDRGQILLEGEPSQVISDFFGSVGKTINLEETVESDYLKLISVNVKSKDIFPHLFDIAETIRIMITYEVKQKNIQFRCSCSFQTQGVVAFTSIEPQEYKHNLGIYCTTIEIPPNLLSEGEYIIGLSFFTSSGTKIRYLKVKEATFISVFDSMKKDSARGDYTQGVLGVVRPLLQWTKEQVEKKMLLDQVDML